MNVEERQVLPAGLYRYIDGELILVETIWEGVALGGLEAEVKEAPLNSGESND